MVHRRSMKSRPCLPDSLLEQLRTDPLTSSVSAIYKPEFDQLRFKLVSGSGSSSTQFSTPDQPKENLAAECQIFSEYKSSPWMDFDPDRNQTWLHLAAEHTDIPLVYELIRLGVAIDTSDSEGMTALLVSIESLRDLVKTQNSLSTSRTRSLVRDRVKRDIEKNERIAEILIKQHADVNLGRDKLSPISVAIQAHRWSLVDLLLRHGALPPPLRQLRFRTQSDERHYMQLLANAKTAGPRPPRPCPCWSGMLLSECHAAGPLPYPNKFICKCGSRKIYANCCATRDFRIEERWDEARKCLVARNIGAMLLPKPDLEHPEVYAEQMRVVNRSMSIMGQLSKDPDSFRRISAKMFARRTGWIMEGFGARPDADPAYLYAVLKSSFFPRPWGKHLSKVECKEYSEEWNKLVDDYMSLGRDRRSRLDIELAAKIGLHGGPLYRHCEAKGCKKVERRDVDKMKCCGSCKLIFYCSTSCQSADWPTHKAACKTLTHKEQQLPSQEIFEETLMASAGRAKTENLNVANLLAMFAA